LCEPSNYGYVSYQIYLVTILFVVKDALPVGYDEEIWLLLRNLFPQALLPLSMFVFLIFVAFGNDSSFDQLALHLCPCIVFAHKLNRNLHYNFCFMIVFSAVNIPLFFHLDKYEDYRSLDWYYELLIVIAIAVISSCIYYKMHNLL